MKFLRILVKCFFFLVMPASAFYLGYLETDRYFQIKKITYPFEYFGIAIGAGLFLWMLGLALFINGLLGSKRRSIK